MNDQAVIDFDPRGNARCLYTELVDLRTLGHLHVQRATRIEFCERTETWQVLSPDGARLLHENASRSECLAWERANVMP